jgi:hypothetical protein
MHDTAGGGRARRGPDEEMAVSWGASELLLELVDRHFAYVRELSGTRQVTRLAHLIAFLESEPVVAALLDDFRAAAEGELAAWTDADSGIRSQLRQIWGTHGDEIRRRLNNDPEGFASMSTYADRLGSPPAATFDRSARADQTEELAYSVQDWWKRCCDQAIDDPVSPDFRAVGFQLSRLRAVQKYNARRLEHLSRSLPWPTFERLRTNARLVNPQPPPAADEVAWAQFVMSEDFATLLAVADEQGADGYEGMQVDEFYFDLKTDARLLHEEIRLQLGLARSRLAVVRRYAARAAAFEAERLREMCSSNSTTAERLLTLDFARLVFDAGLSPVIDANVGGLRPDVLDVASGQAFYVEAKQYDTDYPSSMLKKAYGQVWSTWERVRATYAAPEAFLVVFRRGGPLVALPPVIHHQGLRLYSILADLSQNAGSKERVAAIELKEADLRPVIG